MPSRPERPRVVELFAAPLLGVLGLAEVLVPFESRSGSGSEVACASAVAVVAVSLLWCRRRPGLPAVVFAAAWLAVLVLTGSFFVLFYGHLLTLLVFLFMTVRYGEGRVPLLGGGIVAGFFLGLDVFSSQLRSPGELSPTGRWGS